MTTNKGDFYNEMRIINLEFVAFSKKIVLYIVGVCAFVL